MKRLSNNTLAGLMIYLMLTSLIGTTFISYLTEQRATVSGQVPVQQAGLVGVEVLTPPASAGGSGAGGGAGGGGARGPQTHILDFTIKDKYDIHVMQDDTIITIFKNDVRYILKLNKFVPSKIATLVLDETSFDIVPDKITSVDFNRDTLVDITIEMENDRLIFKLYHQPKAPTKVEPIISQQTKSKPTGEEIPEQPIFPPPKPFNIAFLILIIIIILVIVTYQHFRLRYVEKYQKRKLVKLANEYSKKDRNLENKQAMKVKLEKQMGLLEKSYSMKFISTDAYLKGKRRIKDILNKL